MKSHLANSQIRLFDHGGRQFEADEFPAFPALRGEIVFPGKDLLVEAHDKKRWLNAAAVALSWGTVISEELLRNSPRLRR